MKFRYRDMRKLLGTEGVIEKFLFFPKKIGLEMRWLERAKIKQDFYDQGGAELGETCMYWKDRAWV